MKYKHTSVLKKEAIEFLNVKKGRLYIDATAGGGGHTEEILKLGGIVLAIDRDPEAVKHIKNEFQISNFKFQIGRNLLVVNGNFANVEKIAKESGFGKVSGILFDLGLSTNQLEPQRGFSFLKDGPLDMRASPDLEITAADIINNFEKRRLNEIFQNYGEEKFSWQIADAVCSAREVKKIETTQELANIIREVYRQKTKWQKAKKIDPATKVFQALRIVVNSELLNLKDSLPQTEKLLVKGGRLVIISFHSLEDAIVKRFFKQSENLKVLTKSPVGPDLKELKINPRSRSAKLRAAEKL